MPPWLRFSLIGFVLILLMVLGFFVREARNEIYYLCGNYQPGNAIADVTRQLDTINLSEYIIEDRATGKKIVHSSRLHLGLISCTIEFDANDAMLTKAYKGLG